MKKVVSIILLILAISVLFYTKLYQNRPIGPLVYIGITPVGAPFSFVDDNNNLQGFDVDVANLISEKLNLSPEFVIKKSKKLIKDMKNGEIHLIAGQQKTLINPDYMDLSEVYLSEAALESCLGISNQYGNIFIKQVNDAINNSKKEIINLQNKWHLS